MRRFFYSQPNHLQVGHLIEVTDDIFQHWCKVLRANIGDTATFFDGLGGEYNVILQQINKKTAQVLITDFNPINRALPFHVDIGIVMSRGERMDYAIQKSCELGVNQIQLLTSQHGEVRLKPEHITKKLHHWQAIANSACEQCGLNLVPNICAPIHIDEFIQKSSQSANINIVLAVPSRLSHEQIFSYEKFDKNNKYCVLIGAEGGLSDDELLLAYQHGFLSWQLGERVLRTETAPIVALSYLQAFYMTTMER